MVPDRGEVLGAGKRTDDLEDRTFGYTNRSRHRRRVGNLQANAIGHSYVSVALFADCRFEHDLAAPQLSDEVVGIG